MSSEMAKILNAVGTVQEIEDDWDPDLTRPIPAPTVAVNRKVPNRCHTPTHIEIAGGGFVTEQVSAPTFGEIYQATSHFPRISAASAFISALDSTSKIEPGFSDTIFSFVIDFASKQPGPWGLFISGAKVLWQYSIPEYGPLIMLMALHIVKVSKSPLATIGAICIFLIANLVQAYVVSFMVRCGILILSQL